MARAQKKEKDNVSVRHYRPPQHPGRRRGQRQDVRQIRVRNRSNGACAREALHRKPRPATLGRRRQPVGHRGRTDGGAPGRRHHPRDGSRGSGRGGQHGHLQPPGAGREPRVRDGEDRQGCQLGQVCARRLHRPEAPPHPGHPVERGDGDGRVVLRTRGHRRGGHGLQGPARRPRRYDGAVAAHG